jgi:hypothetical protein
LTTPGIPVMHLFGEIGGWPCTVMWFVPGHALALSSR